MQLNDPIVTDAQLRVLQDSPDLWSCAPAGPAPNNSLALFLYPYPSIHGRLIKPHNIATNMKAKLGPDGRVILGNILPPLCGCLLPANLSKAKEAGMYLIPSQVC
jgi:hypothetical protein